MLENRLFLRKDINFNNNIIFLDIDGVLQPYNNDYRFKYDLNKLQTYLSEKYNNSIYLNIDKFDLGACFYDWNEISIGILKELLNKTNSQLVIHSGWKDCLTKDEIIALFKIKDLDKYIIDVVDRGDKIKAIKKYIETHSMDNYLIIDDSNFTNDFGKNFYLTKDFIKEKDYYECLYYFNHNFEVIDYDTYYICKKDNETFKINKVQIDKFLLLNPLDNINKYDLKIFYKEIVKLNNKKDYLSIACLTSIANKLENLYILEKKYNKEYLLYFMHNNKNNWESFHYINDNMDLIFTYLNKEGE